MGKFYFMSSRSVYSFGLLSLLMLVATSVVSCFSPAILTQRSRADTGYHSNILSAAASSDGDGDDIDLTPDQKKQVVGNLVADDEWEGLGLELTELVRVAVLEDLKKNARDFLGEQKKKLISCLQLGKKLINNSYKKISLRERRL